MRTWKRMAAAFCLAALSPIAAEVHQSPSPPPAKQVLAGLSDGNHRFTTGHAKHPHAEKSRVRDTGAHGQHPQAVILTCADSRVSPEIVFDQGIGDLFSIRVAGNVANEDEAASVEYAVEHLGVPLCVVLGHTGCGAVTAVCRGEHLPHRFDHLLAPIHATVRELHGCKPALKGDALTEAAVRANVWHSVADLLADEALRERARASKLTVVGAIYDTRTGAVRWLGHHPSERSLLGGASARK